MESKRSSCPKDDSNEEDDFLTFDIEDLKNQLGIHEIMKGVNSLSDKVAKRKSDETEQKGVAKRAKLAATTSDNVYDPSVPLLSAYQEHGGLIHEGDDADYIIPSIFEEENSFGPAINEMLAKRINSACVTKPVESKMKDLEEK